VRRTHIFIGQPNIFFVTVNAKDRIPWIGQAVVQSALVKLGQENATAWRVGFYLLMPDHLSIAGSVHTPIYPVHPVNPVIEGAEVDEDHPSASARFIRWIASSTSSVLFKPITTQ
jgi:hypothetical protein